MDPNSQQPTNPEATPPAVPPTPPAAPAPTPPVSPAPVQPASPSPAPVSSTVAPGSLSTPHKGNPIGLIIGAIVVVLLLIVGAAAWFLYFSPAAQAERASLAFMKAVSTKDTETVFALAEATDESTKQFLTSAVNSSEGDFKLIDKTMKDGVGYFLYDLTNESGKQGRTTVEKQDGKYKVSGYDFGSDNLALVPGQSSNTETSGEPAETPQSGGKCLVASDFDQFWLDAFGASAGKPNSDYSKTGIVGNVHFKSSSLEFATGSSEESIKKFSNFAKQHPDHDYVIEMYGSIGATSQDKIQLAFDRVEKVKGIYLKQGGVESKIKVFNSRTGLVTGESYDKIDQGRDRVVVFKIVPSEACSGSKYNSLVQ